jgi:hypothetical protein
MRTPQAQTRRWCLRHPWTLPSDLAALALCGEALAAVGVQLEHAAHGEERPGAVKMHGMELMAARRQSRRGLHDLSGAADQAQWATRLPAFIRRYMLCDGQWHGIPMGIHRANLVWMGQGVERRFCAPPLDNWDEFTAWLHRLQQTVPYPLAVGAEPWQIGLLFEPIVLAVAGPEVYLQAFEGLLARAWLHPLMIESLQQLRRLRAFVDEAAWALPWTAQLERLQTGQGAVQFMGDWVRAQPLSNAREAAAPGTAGHFIAIHDFFVPLARPSAASSGTAAGALTSRQFQVRYARRKGCMPSTCDGWDDVDPQRAALLRSPAQVLPSFVFDQCCAVEPKNAVLEVLSHAFVEREDAVETARRIARLCEVFLESKGLP